ncbi:MAG: polynucleotide adenylyltransferase PcnB [Gammaproteobacteria bacterium]|nr:polynucleotide adenylyltransferase PcnB [Gammaproteobacteria bacterium]
MLTDKLWRRLRSKFKQRKRGAAVVLARQQHKISRAQISPHALKVLYRLKKSGYAAFLVGGGVRDILLKLKPKDFDIATDALPEQIRELFSNSRIIGKRFRLVHIFFHDEIIEVSTFRANSQEQTKDAAEDDELPKMIRSDNTYGTIEEDAWRRDFTINALYYNIQDFSVLDYTGGMLDLKRKQLRMIGDPAQRYHEDPMRLLRAIRLAAKLEFKIEENTEKPLLALKHLLQHVPPSRVFDEVLKLFFKGHACSTFQRLLKYDYLDVLFPLTAAALLDSNFSQQKSLLQLAMHATDVRVAKNASINPGFLFAIILWPALQQRLAQAQSKAMRFSQAMHHAVEDVVRDQVDIVMIPKRFTSMIRAVWVLQYYLISRRTNRLWRTFGHRYFRAAFDFLDLRVKAGEPYQAQIDWWRKFMAANNTKRCQMIEEFQQRPRGS